MVNQRKIQQWLIMVSLVLTLVLCVSLHSYSASFTVNGESDQSGLLPYVVYALASSSGDGENILPIGPNGVSMLGLFDTGSTAVRINDSNPTRTHKWYGLGDDASILGLNALDTNSDPPVTQMVDVWITGMARSIQTTIGESPEALPWITGPGQQADVDANIEKIVVRTDTRPDISLIGAPVSLRVQAIIDYQTVVTRQMPKAWIRDIGMEKETFRHPISRLTRNPSQHLK